MANKKFKVSESPDKDAATLKPTGPDLAMDDHSEFLEACRDLVETGRKKLFVDLVGQKRMLSLFIGTVMDVNSKARTEGRSLTVLAGKDLTSLLRCIAGPDVLEINEETPGPDAE